MPTSFHSYSGFTSRNRTFCLYFHLYLVFSLQPGGAIPSLGSHDCCCKRVTVHPATNWVCYSLEEVTGRQCACCLCGGREREGAKELAEHSAAITTCSL